MAEYTLDEMRDQAAKAATYFERGMEGFDRTFIAVRSGETVIVVARGSSARKLHEFVGSGALGELRGGVEDVRALRPPAEPAQPQTESTVVTDRPVLIALYHEPKEEFSRKRANIHLHVLSDAKLGRRVRLTGECLCSKKKGSKERMPKEDETRMCGECVRVAMDNDLTWTL